MQSWYFVLEAATPPSFTFPGNTGSGGVSEQIPLKAVTCQHWAGAASREQLEGGLGCQGKSERWRAELSQQGLERQPGGGGIYSSSKAKQKSKPLSSCSPSLLLATFLLNMQKGRVGIRSDSIPVICFLDDPEQRPWLLCTSLPTKTVER